MESVDFDLLKSRKKIVLLLQDKEDKNNARQKRLDLREALENEERKKKVEEDELNGYDQYIGAYG